MKSQPTLAVAADLKNLASIRRFVEEAAGALGFEAGIVPKVQLAVDEAATNIITHGYQGQKGSLEIELRREGHNLVVYLRDDAPPFDPTQAAPPDITLPLEQRALGGMGIHLMRQAMDEISHRRRVNGGNELILIKREGGSH
jgi:serine/threonine-protein kinase RsbW